MAANVTILVFLDVMPHSLAVAMFCRANLSPSPFLIIHPEERGSRFFQNIGTELPNH